MVKRLKLRAKPGPELDGLEPELIVAMLHDRVELSDRLRRLVLVQHGPIGFRLDPIRVKRTWCKGRRWVPLVGCLAKMVGMAVVYDKHDGGHVTTVGRESAFETWDLWARAFVKSCDDPLSRGLRMAVLQTMARPVPASNRPARADRECLLWVQHKVAELYPGLRDWSYSGPDEVRLLPAHGGLRMLGSPHPLDYYMGGWHEQGLLKKNAR